MRELPMRIAIMAAALLVAAVGVVVTAVFLCLALYAWLQTVIASPALAALATAGIVFVMSIVVIFLGGALGSSLAARSRRRRAQKGGKASFISAEIGKLLGENAQAFIEKSGA